MGDLGRNFQQNQTGHDRSGSEKSRETNTKTVN